LANSLEVSIPQETVNDESVKVLAWKVDSGSRVRYDQLICEVETSKAVIEIHSPADGVIEYNIAAGTEVAVGSKLCEIFNDTSSSTAPTGALIEQTGASAKPLSTTSSAIATLQTPAARLSHAAAKLAAEYRVTPESFAPGTLVRKQDVLRLIGKPPETTPDARATTDRETEKHAPSNSHAAAGVPVRWVELPRRKIIESRLLATGQANCLPSSVTGSCTIVKLRENLEKDGLSAVGFNALVVFEAARLLRKFPLLNAFHDRGRAAYYEQINIAWAIDGEEGLVAPVVRQADEKSLREIAGAMEQHVHRYVTRSLEPGDFLGATFTVSDLSMDGISFFQPLISQGQSAILGIGSDSEDERGEVLNLTLTFDHQLSEGRMAGRFLRELAYRLEAHDEVAQDASAGGASANSNRHCMVCQQDAESLSRLKACLVKSEVPSGLICSICLAGFS
jgi:pyruvate/2-oxoglutarate dehydrogenase complex dihydrolipoamide acyltransferase (E2) component